jgi:glutaredoxin
MNIPRFETLLKHIAAFKDVKTPIFIMGPNSSQRMRNRYEYQTCPLDAKMRKHTQELFKCHTPFPWYYLKEGQKYQPQHVTDRKWNTTDTSPGLAFMLDTLSFFNYTKHVHNDDVFYVVGYQNCPYCKETVNTLTDNNLRHHFFIVKRDFEDTDGTAQKYRNYTKHQNPSFPVIFDAKHNIVIHGNDRLKPYLQKRL